MSAQTLITELQLRGVVLEVQGDRLCYRAPIGVITPQLHATLKAHKSELIAALASEASNDPESKPQRYVWHYECEDSKAAGTYLGRESDETAVRRIVEQLHGARVIRLERAAK